MTPYLWLASQYKLNAEKLSKSSELWKCIVEVLAHQEWKGNESEFIYELEVRYLIRNKKSIQQAFK